MDEDRGAMSGWVGGLDGLRAGWGIEHLTVIYKIAYLLAGPIDWSYNVDDIWKSSNNEEEEGAYRQTGPLAWICIASAAQLLNARLGFAF